ncbi:DUF2066 domain-containing protein [Rheinheimera sediminis]|uniref:DUF2066 domain-containing protein n=1 Tax=Rheinheimera sp. YQF-1 TaxID=2499626 RepID=UPI000FD90365|nr:DUF2066 domain-containing protein [Rheinheimera sp. YQF-1]RVT49166.1 DUF2066 domain-containing protein [Rheinheimera sp. YQF-1]
MRLLIATLCFVFGISNADAKTLNDLYQAVVPAGQSQSVWQQQALAQVLIKVAVNPDVVEHPEIKAELKNAGNYIKTFAAVSSEQGPALKVGLDEQKIQYLLSVNQIAIWGSRRPTLVLWAVEQTADSRLFMQGANHPVLSQIQQLASAIGLPLDIPTASDTYTAPLSQDEVWAANWLLIEQASLPFNADQTLILLFDQPSAGQYRLTWQGYEADQFVSNELLADSQQELAKQFLTSLTAQLAGKFAVQLGSQQGESELELDIEGLTNFVDQVKVQQLLGAMLTVRQVTVVERQADLLKFKVKLAADRSAFINSLSLERRLQSLQAQLEPALPPEAVQSTDAADQLFYEMAAEMIDQTTTVPTDLLSDAVPASLRYRYVPN